MSDQLISIWRDIIVGDDKSWVLFENGTCVILMEPEDDLAAQAIELMKEWGPVHAGSPAGDFSIVSNVMLVNGLCRYRLHRATRERAPCASRRVCRSRCRVDGADEETGAWRLPNGGLPV